MNCNYTNTASSSGDTQGTRIKHVYGNVLRLAIPLTQRVRTMVDGEETETEAPFYPSPNHPVLVTLNKGGGLVHTFTATMNDNVALVEDDGKTTMGVYQVEVKCYDTNDKPCRYMVRAIVEIVDATIDAGIQAGIEFNAETYTLDGTIYYYAKGDRGISVTNVQQIVESTENGGVNVIRVTLDDGNTFDFNVRNANITPDQDAAMRRVVNWEGVLSIDSDFAFVVPNHTFTELREIMDANNLIHLTFVYENTFKMDFVSKRSLFYGYTFETIEATFHEYDSNSFGLYFLIAQAGDNDSVVFTLRVLDSNSYYTKTAADAAIARATEPITEKLSYKLVDTLPLPYVADAGKLYIIKDNDLSIYKGYFPSGDKWFPFGYLRPDGGIPKSDLEASVQATLSHADDTYTKAEVDAAIQAARLLVFVYVGELPTASANTLGKIYLVPNGSSAARNYCDEYITVQRDGYKWEKIGSTDVNLDNYATLDYVASKTKMLKLRTTNPIEWESGHEAIAKAMFAGVYKGLSGGTGNTDTDAILPIYTQQNGYIYHFVRARYITNESHIIQGVTSIFHCDQGDASKTMTITTTRTGNITSLTIENDATVEDKYIELSGYYTLQKHNDGNVSFYDYNDAEVDFNTALGDLQWHKSFVHTDENLDPMGEGDTNSEHILLYTYQKAEYHYLQSGVQTYHFFINISDGGAMIRRLTLLETNTESEHTLVFDDLEEINLAALNDNGKIDPYLFDDETRAALEKARNIKYVDFDAVDLLGSTISTATQTKLVAFRENYFSLNDLWYIHYDSNNTSTSIPLTITSYTPNFVFSFFVDGKFVRIEGTPSNTYTADIYNLINNTHNSITLQ